MRNKGQFFLTEFKLINVEQMMEREKPILGKQQSNNCYRKELSTNVKFNGLKCDEK